MENYARRNISLGIVGGMFASIAMLCAPAAHADQADSTGGAASTGGIGEKIKIGIFLGAHIFSKNNELGVQDTAAADSPANAGIGGVRASYEVIPHLAIEGEFAIMPTEARDSGSDLTAFGFRAQAVYSFADRGARVIPFALAGTSWLSSLGDGTVRDDADWSPVHAGGGVKYKLQGNVGLRADARFLLPPSSASDGLTVDYEVTLGLYTTFGSSKRKPIPAPERPADPDADGIVGAADKCPNGAEDKDGFEDEDGCPDLDNDSDGIADATDKCPNKAETKNDIDDDDGCPELDEDGDGLLGSQDSCLNEAEDKDGFKDEDGCPDLDNDDDGVADTADKCPLEPETANGFEDADGCPDTLPKKIAKFTGAIKGIRFATNKAKLLRSSNRVLNRAVNVLTEFPSLKLEIQGHTDSVGDDAKNQTLSEERAAAVKTYLESKGIDASRLTAVGFGETKPVEDNKTKKHRAANRRVEFKLIP